MVSFVTWFVVESQAGFHVYRVSSVTTGCDFSMGVTGSVSIDLCLAGGGRGGHGVNIMPPRQMAGRCLV